MTVSFAAHIAPLFTNTDSGCMAGQGVILTSYTYMSDPRGDDTFPDHANARHVLARVKGDELPRMPLHAPAWSADRVSTFSNWIDGGFGQ